MEIYDGTADSVNAAASAGGTAFHTFLDAEERGIDSRYFNANVEFKTSFGTPTIDDFLEAVKRAERSEPGQLNVVHYFDMRNNVKYFIQW
jgi:hypothetical protein